MWTHLLICISVFNIQVLSLRVQSLNFNFVWFIQNFVWLQSDSKYEYFSIIYGIYFKYNYNRTTDKKYNIYILGCLGNRYGGGKGLSFLFATCKTFFYPENYSLE